MDLENLVSRDGWTWKSKEQQIVRGPCPICSGGTATIRLLGGSLIGFCTSGCKKEELLKEVMLSVRQLKVARTAETLSVTAGEGPSESLEPCEEAFPAEGVFQASSNGFSRGRIGPSLASNGNGKVHHPEFGKWKLELGYMIKGSLDDLPEKDRPTIASLSQEKLTDIIVDKANEIIAGQERPLWPLPEASQTEIDEEIRALAEKAVAVFRGAYNLPAPYSSANGNGAVTQWEGGEEEIRTYELGALYSLIDEWDRQPWVWEGILPRASLSLIVGKSETGKSTLIYSLIYAVVTGGEFFGRKCEQGKVLYLAGDPMADYVAGKMFRSLGLQDGVIVVRDALVSYRSGMEQLRRIVSAQRPSLVVGDTMAATITLDTDKYGQSYSAQQPLTKLAREFGPNFLMSHHSQKSAVDSYSVIDAALGSVGVAAVASSRMGTKVYRRKGKRYHTFAMSNLRVGNPLEGEYIIHKLDNGLVELGGLWETENRDQDKKLIAAVLQRKGELAKRTLWQECRPKPKWDAFNDALDEMLAQGEISISTNKRNTQLIKLN